MWRREGFATATVAGAIAREGTTPRYVSPIGRDWNLWSISESRHLMNRQAQSFEKPDSARSLARISHRHAREKAPACQYFA
jgi:hypothetical protein